MMSCNFIAAKRFLCTSSLGLGLIGGPTSYHRHILRCEGLCLGLIERKLCPVILQSKNKYSKNKKDAPDDPDSLAAAIADKYRIFRDEDSMIILDIVEERRINALRILDVDNDKKDEFCGINLKRGIHGVFDIDDLVELLRRDKGQDIFVAKLPCELKYVDYIVVVTGKSHRHMLVMAEFVRKVFKRKMYQNDIIPRIEGENCRDWIALDLGNIALHIFSKTARQVYDLESLWAVGAEYDELCNKPEDPLVALLQKHSVYLGDLQPSETNA